jgi:anaerobic dimethyl sulfoxide reductase subunit B (iron-sulfur subunit)
LNRHGFRLDLKSCIGCKSCQAACKDKNELPVGLLWRRVVEVSGGDWIRRGSTWVDNTFTYFVSLSCMHCADPICVEVCPTGAMSARPDGIVNVDPDRCMGCRYCEMACPYGAPRLDHDRGVMTKCDFCRDEVDRGGAPACVRACPMRVLDWGPVEEDAAREGLLTQLFPLPDAGLTNPSGVFEPHRDTHRATNEPARVGNREEI